MASKQSVKLLRPGASEHKRSDLAHSYMQASKLFTTAANGKNWKDDKQELFELFKQWDINKSVKEENKLTREKSLFEKLNLIEKGKTIIPTRLAYEYSNSINDEEIDYIYGMSKTEFDFMQIFIFDDYSNAKQGIIILEKILNHEEIAWVSNENFKNGINEDNAIQAFEIIKNDLKFLSGGKKGVNAKYKNNNYSLANSKNLISETWLSDSYNKIHGKIIGESEIIEMIKSFANSFDEKINVYCKSFLDLFIPSDANSKEIKQYESKIRKLEFYDEMIPSDYNEIFKRVVNRSIKGSIDSYMHLIKNHLRFIVLVGEDSNNFYIKNEYKKLVEIIIEKYDELLKIFKHKGYITKEDFKILINLDNFEIESDNDKIYETYLNEYGSIEKITNLLKLFDIQEYDSENEMRLKISSYLESSKHIKGMCSHPAFYEFVIGLAMLIKHNDIFNLDSKKFVKTIRESLNLKFKSDNLTPYLHAPGRRPDINIFKNEGDIIVEPTMQMERQTSMEADSIKSHLNSYERKISEALFISPSIEETIKVVFKAWLSEGLISSEVKSLTTKDFIEYINR